MQIVFYNQFGITVGIYLVLVKKQIFMKLTKFSYTSPEWELKNLELSSINLIVAKNATGKSRCLEAINLLINTITQRITTERIANWELEFVTDDNNIIEYKFNIILNKLEYIVVDEYLFVNNEKVLFRENNQAKLKNELTNSDDYVYPPINRLVLHTNRDVKKYPYLEEITNWAENSFGLRFANINPDSNSNRFQTNIPVDKFGDIPKLFNSLNDQSRNDIIEQINSTGYFISEIKVIGYENVFLAIKENGIDKYIWHDQIAQGMYRTLSLIVYIEYLLFSKKVAMIYIDDFCEGLDYERATKLGRLIFDKCKDSNIQLIATSNDSFLMEVVDIKYWNILIRNGKTVTTLSYKNNPALFDDFRFTGLSNFDFFSSDFLKHEIR